MQKIVVPFLAAVFISGCTPARLTSQIIPPETARGKVLVYREHAYQYSAVSIVFGSNGVDLAKIYDKGRAEVVVAAGNHSFFVRTTQADRPFSLSLNVVKDETICLMTKAKPSFYMKMFLPMSTFFTSSFTLEKAPCSLAEFSLRT